MKRAWIFAALAIASGTSHSAGFALIEQNASGVGNAYAGAAAIAEDASTIFFNPAGMTQLPDNQFVLSGYLVKPTFRFSGSVSPSVGGENGGDAGSWALLPHLYFAQRISPDAHAGFGINTLGLKTKYDNGWMGRFHALGSELRVINLNPAIAWKINDKWSLGAGLNLQHAEATLTNNISPLAPGSFMTISANGNSLGYNLGLMWQPGEDTRIGLSYRSSVKHTLEGGLKASDVLPSGAVKSDLTLPDIISLGLFQRLSPSLDFLADVTRTGWSGFDKLAVAYKQFPIELVTPENWEDSMRYSVGLIWHVNSKLNLRGGLAYDETPIPNATSRTPRIPDGSRTLAAIGAQYRINKSGRLDLGYAHLFIKDSPIKSTSETGITLTGKYNSYIDVISLQYTHDFD